MEIKKRLKWRKLPEAVALTLLLPVAALAGVTIVTLVCIEIIWRELWHD